MDEAAFAALDERLTILRRQWLRTADAMDEAAARVSALVAPRRRFWRRAGR